MVIELFYFSSDPPMTNRAEILFYFRSPRGYGFISLICLDGHGVMVPNH